MTAGRSKSEEQKVARKAKIAGFRKVLGPFVVAAETTRMPMVFTDANDPGHPIIFANDSFLSLTGYERRRCWESDFNFPWQQRAMLSPSDESTLHSSATLDNDLEVLYRRKDGSACWATIFVNPVRDERGALAQHFVSLVDVTKLNKHTRKRRRSSMSSTTASRTRFPPCSRLSGRRLRTLPIQRPSGNPSRPACSPYPACTIR